MVWLKRILILVVILAIGWLGWNWQFGPMRWKRDIRTFADVISTCTPYDQTYLNALTGDPMDQSVVGETDGLCEVRMATLGPEVLVCKLDAETRPVFAEGFGAQADNISFFGSIKFRYSSSDPDPLTQIMNSEACVTEGG